MHKEVLHILQHNKEDTHPNRQDYLQAASAEQAWGPGDLVALMNWSDLDHLKSLVKIGGGINYKFKKKSRFDWKASPDKAEQNGFQEFLVKYLVGKHSSFVRIPIRNVLDHFLPKIFFCNRVGMNCAFLQAQRWVADDTGYI